MKSILNVLALATAAVAVSPMANPEPAIPATGSPPAGCSTDYSGTFVIQNTILPGTSGTAKRTPPQEGPASTPYLTLSGGILRDQNARFGYIASNNQFQFDNPIQAGAIITEGWSACSNNTLALGGSTVFWQCTSGDFYNLYNIPVRTGCIPINLSIIAAAPTVSMSAIPGATSVSYGVSTYGVAITSSSPVASSYVAPTSSSPTPVAVSSSAVVVSSSAVVSSYVAPSTSAVVVSSPASSVPAVTSYTGAAQPLATAGSFFAVLAGAVGAALI